MTATTHDGRIWTKEKDGLVVVGFCPEFMDTVKNSFAVLPFSESSGKKLVTKAPMMTLETPESLVTVRSPLPDTWLKSVLPKCRDFPDRLTPDDVVMDFFMKEPEKAKSATKKYYTPNIQYLDEPPPEVVNNPRPPFVERSVRDTAGHITSNLTTTGLRRGFAFSGPSLSIVRAENNNDLPSHFTTYRPTGLHVADQQAVILAGERNTNSYLVDSGGDNIRNYPHYSEMAASVNNLNNLRVFKFYKAAHIRWSSLQESLLNIMGSPTERVSLLREPGDIKGRAWFIFVYDGVGRWVLMNYQQMVNKITRAFAQDTLDLVNIRRGER